MNRRIPQIMLRMFSEKCKPTLKSSVRSLYISRYYRRHNSSRYGYFIERNMLWLYPYWALTTMKRHLNWYKSFVLRRVNSRVTLYSDRYLHCPVRCALRHRQKDNQHLNIRLTRGWQFSKETRIAREEDYLMENYLIQNYLMEFCFPLNGCVNFLCGYYGCREKQVVQ